MPGFLPALAKWAPTILSAVGGIVGRNDEQKYRNQDYAFQKEFAQHGIRWRVEDAEAAGLHPLYALGAQTPSYSPSYVQGNSSAALSDMGQNISRAVGATQTVQERKISDANLRLIESQIGETDARRDYYASEAARNAQGVGAVGFVRNDGSDVDSEQFQNVVRNTGNVQVRPSQVTSSPMHDRSVSAGVNPGWSRFNLGEGVEVVLPSVEGGGMSEAVEALSESAVMMALTIAENRRRYGPEAAQKFIDQFVPDMRSDQHAELPWVLRMLDYIPGVSVSRSQ